MSPVLKILHLPQSKAQVLLVPLSAYFCPPHLKPHLWYRALLHSSMAVLATLLFLTQLSFVSPKLLFAREAAATFDLPFVMPQVDFSESDIDTADLVDVEIRDTDLCSRYPSSRQ